jgi:hypothetical protein
LRSNAPELRPSTSSALRFAIFALFDTASGGVDLLPVAGRSAAPDPRAVKKPG